MVEILPTLSVAVSLSLEPDVFIIGTDQLYGDELVVVRFELKFVPSLAKSREMEATPFASEFVKAILCVEPPRIIAARFANVRVGPVESIIKALLVTIVVFPALSVTVN